MKCVHAGECELLETVLDRLVPLRVVHPETAIASVAVRSAPHAIHPQSTVIDRVTELSCDADAKLLRALVHLRAPGVACAGRPDANWVEVRLTVEGDIWMRVQEEAVCAWEHIGPLCLTLEAVMDTNVRAVALTESGDASDDLVCLVVAVRV